MHMNYDQFIVVNNINDALDLLNCESSLSAACAFPYLWHSDKKGMCD